MLVLTIEDNLLFWEQTNCFITTFIVHLCPKSSYLAKNSTKKSLKYKRLHVSENGVSRQE